VRQAFDLTVEDPEFLADAKRLGQEIHPIAWQEMDSLVRRVLAAPKRATDLLKTALSTPAKSPPR
jgi:hypothetical protein